MVGVHGLPACWPCVTARGVGWAWLRVVGVMATTGKK